MRGLGRFSPLLILPTIGALDIALSDPSLSPYYPTRVARRGRAALLPKPEHVLPEGKCGYRPTGGKRAARRQRAKGN